jgi:hypothetical protein
MKCLLKRMLDETEFLSDSGIRSLSHAHLEAPYVFSCMSHPICVHYAPGESESGVFGEQDKFQTDPQFRDYILFYEYFHGDTGRGVGASHQTGWKGLVAKLLQPHGHD